MLFRILPSSKVMPLLRSAARRRRLSLSEHAYLVVKERILKGELALGAPLSRRKLAAEFGMSLLPVAEALQLLESEGLVESRPRVGTRVFLPSADDIRDLYVVREALETQSARRFAEKASTRDRLELEKMAQDMDAMFNRCAAGNDPDRDYLYAVQSFHMRLHLRIAEGAGCRALCETIERNHVLLFNWLFDVTAQRPPLPPRFHRDLAEALNRGVVTAADRAMRKHVRYGLEAVVDKLGPRTVSRGFERVK
jgi:DNA-binding GntR family transcriptional regulator